MTEPPEISVVIPAFESLELLSACLASVRAQAGVRAEIIVSDDSRSDRICDYVRSSFSEGGVDYVEGARSGNPVDNWNHGLARARSPVRVLVHQDEVLIDPHYLRDAVGRLTPGVAAVIGRTVVVGGLRRSRHAVVSAVGRRLPGAARFLPLINWIGPTAAFVFRGAHRFDPSLVQLADVEFYGRVLTRGRYFVLPGARVGSRGYHADQITAGIDPVSVALRELDALAGRTPPAIGRFTRAAARLATRARRWGR